MSQNYEKRIEFPDRSGVAAVAEGWVNGSDLLAQQALRERYATATM